MWVTTKTLKPTDTTGRKQTNNESLLRIKKRFPFDHFLESGGKSQETSNCLSPSQLVTQQP